MGNNMLAFFLCPTDANAFLPFYMPKIIEEKVEDILIMNI